jgi:glutamate formiminotransferase / 5-formyltetrahydrofolate cyclo-ligase
MTGDKAFVECVPNFSEGRNSRIIEQIVDCFRGRDGVKLLDYSNDSDHNRMVVTAIGEPQSMKAVLLDAIGTAVRLINLNVHRGEHPRLGAADVVPFIPIRNIGMEEVVCLAREVAAEAAIQYDLPVYLYESAATAPHRANLADVRKGQFEGLIQKMASPLWQPDFGPAHPHPTAGASIIGARHFLIAWNVNLRTNDLEIAQQIARKIRFSNGGFPCVKALGFSLCKQGIVQVSMNLTDFNQTGMHQVFDFIKQEATELGVEITGSELIGMLPMMAVADSFAHYLKLDGFDANRILEYRLLE